MIFRAGQVFLFCLLAITCESDGRTQNSSPKRVDKLNPHAGQNFVVNNNCGLAKTEREMMAHIKAKVDFITAQSGNKGKVKYSDYIHTLPDSFYASTKTILDRAFVHI